MTLYYFTRDTVGKSNATAAVLANWPIFYVANFVVPPSLNAADFGTITRDDGQKMTTYKGWPLYYYIKDQAAGDVLGQGVGSVWFVIDPANFPPPIIQITAPSNNSTVPSGNVTVTVQVSNFNVVDKQGQANVAREGHLHYYLDVAPPTTPGQPAVPPSGVWAHVAATTYTFPNVAAGTHTIYVQLVNNDHTPLIPLVIAQVAITATPTPTPAGVTINLIAQSFAFNMATITVPPGASVTVNFNNMDTGVPHNFAVYTNSSATTPIFVGQTITGRATITYTFTAPTTPGNYFFRCDRHPVIMTGTFIVGAASSSASSPSSGGGDGGGGGGY